MTAGVVDLEPDETAVRVRAAGKVNLVLRCGPAGADGYHRLRTTFQAVSVYDELLASPAAELSVRVSGAQAESVPTGPENLAVRAAALLQRSTGVTAGAALRIHKGIPVSGGMAGGSADAAAALVACDSLWGTELTREQLAVLGRKLGADVPFAVHGHTAVGTVRGDELSPVLTAGQFHWALAFRHEGLSTAAVYARFDEDFPEGCDLDDDADVDLMRALRTGDAVGLGAALHNDLQPAALALAPYLRDTLDVAREAGALGAVVSGSGPTVAALGRSAQHATALAAAFMAEGVADDVRAATGPVAGAVVVG